MRFRIFILILGVCLFPGLMKSVAACKLTEMSSPEDIVDEADYIVIAKATKYVASPTENHPIGKIDFSIKTFVKGQASINRVIVDGILTETDDFNTNPVPYKMVRPQGQRGNCFALWYRKGADHLLFLRKNIEPIEEWMIKDLSPYWAPLAAVNEQLRGGDDPWLKWVRDRIKQQNTAPNNSFNRTPPRGLAALGPCGGAG